MELPGDVSVKKELGMQSMQLAFQSCFNGVGGPFPEAEFQQLFDEFMKPRKVVRTREMRSQGGRARNREDVTTQRAVDTKQHALWLERYNAAKSRWAQLVLLRMLQRSMLQPEFQQPWRAGGDRGKDSDSAVQVRDFMDLTQEFEVLDLVNNEKLLREVDTEIERRERASSTPAVKKEIRTRR